MVCENGSGTQLMRAAIIEAADATPVVGLLPRPVPGPGEVLVKVLAAGLNPHDLIVAAGIRRPPPVPYVTGIEGVGQLTDGTRVYFSPGPLPGGSMAECAAVPDGNITAVPTGLDADAIGVGAAGHHRLAVAGLERQHQARGIGADHGGYRRGWTGRGAGREASRGGPGRGGRTQPQNPDHPAHTGS